MRQAAVDFPPPERPVNTRVVGMVRSVSVRDAMCNWTGSAEDPRFAPM